MRPARTARMILVLTVALCIAEIAPANEPPVADAGLPRYAATDPVQLDGSGSYDPDQSGPLSYTWTQVSGPSVVIASANTAEPTISGFVQTDEIQECEFELIVSDGDLTSLPDIVKVVVVPDFGESILRLENKSFDPKKPTTIYFGGGDCTTGHTGQYIPDPDWLSRANVIDFPYGYTPDSDGGELTYYKYGDMIIAYLSSVAPDYKQAISSGGFSTGGMPAIDVGIRLNQTYRDARYAVNQVTFCDATPVCRDYSASISTFLGSSVDGEQCWVDNYVDNSTRVYPGVLNVRLSLSHVGVNSWYGNSLTGNDMNQFNNGVVAGAYWSVIGPGKNLQLGPAPGATYAFQWHGSTTSGYMDFFDESLYPGRLPEPVTLGAWANISEFSGDFDGAVLSCHESENAVGYQLLFGSDPHRVAHYEVISDTPIPPTDVIRDFPSEETWWTIRVRDEYGSTIYADPMRLDLEGLPPLSVTNARAGKRYGLITHAILDAEPGDDILLDPGIHEENIEFGGVPLTVRSLDPNDPTIVAGTIIKGLDDNPTVTFSGPESGGCVLVGLTIQSGTVGVSCRDAAPMIRDCIVESPDGIAIEYWHGQPPELIDCTVLGQTKEGGDLGLVAYWKLDESSGVTVHDSESDNHGTVEGTPGWRPAGGRIGGALQFDGTTCITADFVLNPAEGPFSVLTWVRGGAPGQVIVSQEGGANWLMADPATGALMTELKCGGRCAKLTKALGSDAIITDGAWHRIGVIWDGASRRLYADGVLVAEDTQDGLADSSGGLILGCGKNMTPDTCWTGLIDDVRIYNRAVKP